MSHMQWINFSNFACWLQQKRRIFNFLVKRIFFKIFFQRWIHSKHFHLTYHRDPQTKTDCGFVRVRGSLTYQIIKFMNHEWLLWFVEKINDLDRFSTQFFTLRVVGKKCYVRKILSWKEPFEVEKLKWTWKQRPLLKRKEWSWKHRL